ncbi:MAG: hypothetical protein V4458_16820 [Pseudomonadota bacterium]|nr:hypothetical protein [Afipia sp.]
MITMFDPDDPRRARSIAEMKAEQVERDFDLCVSIMQREMSDYVRGYRTCRLGACRRARRCASISRDCIATMPRIPLSSFEQACAIEDILQEIVRRRRERRAQKPA